MATTETATPMFRATCCLAGVAATRKPVVRSCDVLPAFAEAMHTTPPMLMARAKKAGAVQPMTRNIAQVAIKVAMAIPEIGLEEVPISPVIREDTVTKRKPNTTTRRAAMRLLKTDV